ncbi:MAG: DoxX family protein [Planctomycetota bacterium]|jgi:uncharacterized membrane protein YphA (DoxX/SURF4 family)
MAKTKKSAGSFVPLVMRIVLFAAFVPVGLHLLFTTMVFLGDDARILSELGVGRATEAESIAASRREMIVPAASVGLLVHQDQDQDQQQPPELEPELADPIVEGLEEAADNAASMLDHPLGNIDPEVSVPPISAKAVHQLTVSLERAGWKTDYKPDYAAWAGGITCLAGGFMVIIGFLSRLWAFGLTLVAGAVFALDSAHLVPTILELDGSEGMAGFNQVFAQLGLFTLALAVLFLGPGRISIDRYIFGSRDDEDEGIISVDVD